jgi:hypothetical protein
LTELHRAAVDEAGIAGKASLVAPLLEKTTRLYDKEIAIWGGEIPYSDKPEFLLEKYLRKLDYYVGVAETPDENEHENEHEEKTFIPNDKTQRWLGWLKIHTGGVRPKRGEWTAICTEFMDKHPEDDWSEDSLRGAQKRHRRRWLKTNTK